jgi:hypothetical protein
MVSHKESRQHVVERGHVNLLGNRLVDQLQRHAFLPPARVACR